MVFEIILTCNRLFVIVTKLTGSRRSIDGSVGGSFNIQFHSIAKSFRAGAKVNVMVIQIKRFFEKEMAKYQAK